MNDDYPLPKTRHLKRTEAVRLLIDYAEAYSLGQREDGLPDNEHVAFVKLIDRLLKKLTGKDPELEDVARVLPYE